MEDNKAIARDVINWLCRDDVIFQHIKNLGDPTKLRSMKGVLQRFKEKGYLNDQGWTDKIDCPDLKAPHFNRQQGGGSSTEDRMTKFMNRSVEEVLLLAGDSKIKRIWSSEYCQKPLPGDPLVQDWRCVFTLAEMKQHGVDMDKPEWFDEMAKRANTIWSCQDARNFVIILMFVGEAFTFAFFDCRGAVCLDMLNIMDDTEEFLQLVLYLSLADPGMVGLETSIMQNEAGRFIRSRVFGPEVPINMVLFISNNIHGRRTMAHHVTLSRERIAQALQSGGSWGAMEKWLKGMEKEVDVVVKDTWVDLTAPHTEGMILNYLRLKGVQGVTRLLFEGLVVGPASPPPHFQLHDHPGIGSLKDISAISQTGDINVWSSTVYNRSFWGVPTLALAHKSMARSVNKYDHSHPVPEGVTVPKLEPVTREVYQDCVYEALVAIADCIRSHGQAFSPYIISEGGNETDELFPISFMQADTSMWNMGLVHPAMSDWGYIDHTRIDPSNIRRGLLYDHAFASWNTRSTSMRGRPPSKIFAKHAGTASTLSSQDEALHFDDSLVHHPAHSPAHASVSHTLAPCNSASGTSTDTSAAPSASCAPAAPTNVSPVPHSDAPSMSIIPSAPPTSMIPSQPASTAPSRGRRGTGKGKGKQGGRKGTDGRKSTPGAVNAPPDSSAATRKRGFDSVSQGKPADGPSKRQAPLHHVPKVNIKPKHVVQSLQVDVAGYGSLNIDNDLE
ncbi:uncharacterized protein EDB91DRAFT_1248924 [Suillus paluster]|uniref:uncharacterized protein n=1 Tax=Suillus paluster TaxID=48578 RepID=UPI001B877954|nr:uncharacterized protein EDB91DRAFT_1248924 [Suillus paluster]KAG1739165.1 hypothetical protein EDB91DRAFT_1248924 [Suillus paluster]